MSDYTFSSLSPADFEDLARDLIGAELGVRFEAFGAGPDGGMDGRHAKAGRTTILQAKHYAGSTFRALQRAMAEVPQALNPFANPGIFWRHPALLRLRTRPSWSKPSALCFPIRLTFTAMATSTPYCENLAISSGLTSSFGSAAQPSSIASCTPHRDASRRSPARRSKPRSGSTRRTPVSNKRATSLRPSTSSSFPGRPASARPRWPK